MFQATDGDQQYRGFNGDKTESVFDTENNQIIVRPDPFTVSPGCVSRPAWQMAICPPVYGKVTITQTCLYNMQRFLRL